VLDSARNRSRAHALQHPLSGPAPPAL
jgi:hypothetical protein